MQKKFIYMLLLGAGVIILIMIAIILTNQYKAASTQPSSTSVTQPTEAPTGTPQSTPPIADKSKLPEGVLALYFERWNAKDADGMDTLWIPANRGENTELYQMDLLSRIDQISCVRQPNESIPEELTTQFSTAHELAYVLADYTIHYNEAGREEYMRTESERTAFPFLLIREKEGDDWLIAVQGY